jgi:putative tryptophan/tyrosine transport system substrate-binding protein
MRRREFVAGVAGAAAWPLVAGAQQTVQQTAIPTIGYLAPETPRRFASRVRAFQEGLAEVGYIEHRNINVEFRWA